jgi:hypothetical protein
MDSMTFDPFGETAPKPMPDASDAHMSQCDDSGNCTCIRIASIGHEGVWGPCSMDSTTALQNWLNTQSTAKVDNYDTTKPTLTAAFLAQYDVILLQWMVANGKQGNDGAPWQFSTDEISALKDWVNAGGGIVALNGYQATDPTAIEDIYATNQLLSFTDIKFNKVVDITSSMVPGNSDCWGGSVPLGGPVGEGGIASVGTWDMTTPIGRHVTSVGALDMRSITATTATPDCTNGTSVYAVHEQIGNGHVVAYGDEWVTYSGEWLGTATCIMSARYSQCTGQGENATQLFQIPQFWYNAIKYAASSVTCFTIMTPPDSGTMIIQ